MHNLNAIQEACGMRDSDRMFSWLPLYHDMGLIGFFALPLRIGMPLTMLPTEEFQLNPSQWMQYLSDEQTTITGAPDVAYRLATRSLRRREKLDLSRLRLAFNGSEPVSQRTVQAFSEAGARHGFRPTAMLPVYGLAEACLAVTFPNMGEYPRFDIVSSDSLSLGDTAGQMTSGEHTSALACVGQPIGGVDVRVVKQDGTPCAEREVGVIEVRGPSVVRTLEYGEETVDVIGWLSTGDLGYRLEEGDLVVCGRVHDVITIGGRKYLPHEVEEAAASVASVRMGRCVAFGVSPEGGLDYLVVVAEVRSSNGGVEQAIRTAVSDRVGVVPRSVALVPKGALPRTSSGKLQRLACRTMYLSDALPTLRT